MVIAAGALAWWDWQDSEGRVSADGAEQNAPGGSEDDDVVEVEVVAE